MHTILRSALLLLLALGVNACAPNTAWRKVGVADCRASANACEDGTVASTENFAGYKVSYVEFSERGNLFDPGAYQDLMKQLRQEAAEPGGALVVVFVHGWKHNAAPDDSNVIEFRKAMNLLAQSSLKGNRTVHGVYLGWRGLALHGLGLENITFWDRKAAAEEIGRGAVTELLLDVETITGRAQTAENRNILLVVGHSFGGAMVLSAVNEVLADRMNTFLANDVGGQKGPYPAFGDGVILLNPAIEANQGLHLKELGHLIGQANGNRAKPLHVVSSEGDIATHKLFPIGQWLGTRFTWNHQTLERQFLGKPFSIPELDLDITTVGNYQRFRTDTLMRRAGSEGAAADWSVTSQCEGQAGQAHDAAASPIPCTGNDPIAFVYTSPEFIKDHNDVFNPKVIAYMAATVSESLYQRTGSSFAECLEPSKAFAFERCFARHLGLFTAREKALEPQAK